MESNSVIFFNFNQAHLSQTLKYSSTIPWNLNCNTRLVSAINLFLLAWLLGFTRANLRATIVVSFRIQLSVSFRIPNANHIPTSSVSPNFIPILVPTGTHLPGARPGATVLPRLGARALITPVKEGVSYFSSQSFTVTSSVETTVLILHTGHTSWNIRI